MDTELAKELNALLLKMLIIAIPGMIVNLLFSVAVLRDANKEKRKGKDTELAGPKVWAFATLIGGIFVAAAYWLIHHSTLRRVKEAEHQVEKEWA